MPEVYSISGFGQPAGWELTPNGNYGAPAAGCPAKRRAGGACRHPAAIALQKALKKAGAPIEVDGFVGPSTAAAVAQVLGIELSPEEVAARAKTLAVKVIEKGLPEVKVPKKKKKAAAAATPGRRLSTAAWAVVGLSALAAGTGAWMAYGGMK